MAANEDTYFTYPTPHGPVTILASKRGICEIAFDKVDFDGRNAASAIANLAANELQEYLAGKRKRFDVPLDLRGSAFQKAVWTEVAAIGYGETRTAADVAEAIGKPGAHRSVGTAARANKLAPFIPTHRIVAAGATGKQARIFRAFVALEKHALSSSQA